VKKVWAKCLKSRFISKAQNSIE